MIGRKLRNTLQGLELLTKQESVKGFLNDSKNADSLSGFVGDIHDAVMDYQVCIQSESVMLMSDTHSRLHCNRTSMKRVASSL